MLSLDINKHSSFGHKGGNQPEAWPVAIRFDLTWNYLEGPQLGGG